jgi:hypothetical protein
MVKLHPRDNKEDWNGLGECSFLNLKGPIEKIYPTLKEVPIVVLGFTSTALLTLKAFYGARCASISPFIRKTTATKFNKDEEFFVKSFSNEIEMINSTEKFNCFINTKGD